ncbi:Uncharacterised protein [uncultured archaeon]|nr:Uncharacterised protein [uncultured archaeon]
MSNQGNKFQIHLVALDDGTPLARIILQNVANPDIWLDVLATADDCVQIGTTFLKAARQLREVRPPGSSPDGKTTDPHDDDDE